MCLWATNRTLKLVPLCNVFALKCLHAQSLQSRLTLCDLMDCSLPGSSVQGILQASILDWFVVPSSRGSAPPRDRTGVSLQILHWQSGSLPLAPSGKPYWNIYSVFLSWILPLCDKNVKVWDKLANTLWANVSINDFKTFLKKKLKWGKNLPSVCFFPPI